jgi:RND superfamily putative drug exporter
MTERPDSTVAGRAAGWSARHRRSTIAGWLAFVTIAVIVGAAVGQRHLTDVQQGNGESRQATAIYEGAFRFHTGEQILVQGTGAIRLGSPTLTAATQDLLVRLHRIPTIDDVRSPLTPAGAMLRSADGRSMLVTFDVAGDFNQAQQNVDAALAATAAVAGSHPGVIVQEFGAASTQKALAGAFIGDARKAEYTSVPVTLIILVFAFGSLIAAGVPLLLGITSVLAALGLMGPISHLVPVNPGQLDAVIALIGLAVGVDYSMFYLRRKLEERHRGLDNDTALARAAATSGRAVLVSGLTVMTAMAGMFMAGNAVFSSLAMGTMLVVAIAVLGSLTVLPAVLSALGDNVERGRAPLIARRRERGASRAWSYVVDGVLAVPVLSLVVSSGLLIALAVPALGMHTVNPGMVGLPPHLQIMRTYERMQRAFPGGPIPAVVVVQSPDVTRPDVQRQIARMGQAALATGQMRGPIVVAVSPDHTVATVTISLTGDGTDRRSDRALATLRQRVIPSTVATAPGTHAYVFGTTAGSRDFTDTMKAHLPLVFAFVLGLAFLLLLITFRSLAIPTLTIVLNLLSVGAAYGLLTLIFQDGHLRGALGGQDIGGIIDWLPLFLFVVLFGLSMDYHVLILSRIREAHENGRRTGDAVAEGIKSTAGIVTSAAVVMVAVFSIFAILPEIMFKQLGVGLAAAVLIDATVVRIVLLPSAMALLGERAWYLPGRARQASHPGALPRPRSTEPAR